MKEIERVPSTLLYKPEPPNLTIRSSVICSLIRSTVTYRHIFRSIPPVLPDNAGCQLPQLARHNVVESLRIDRGRIKSMTGWRHDCSQSSPSRIVMARDTSCRIAIRPVVENNLATPALQIGPRTSRHIHLNDVRWGTSRGFCEAFRPTPCPVALAWGEIGRAVKCRCARSSMS